MREKSSSSRVYQKNVGRNTRNYERAGIFLREVERREKQRKNAE